MSQRFALSLVTVLLAGCAYLGAGSSPEPSAETVAASIAASAADPTEAPLSESTASAAAEPAESPSANTTASPTPTIEPSSSPTGPSHWELAASDRFWRNFYDTCFFGVSFFPIPSTLMEIVEKSDAVFRGMITGVENREFRQSPDLTYATVKVTEVLIGNGRLGGADELEVQIGLDAIDLTDIRPLIPEHDHLWFVKGSDDVPGTFYTTTYTQVSVVRNIDGIARVIMPEAIANAYSREQFPVPFDGTSFEQLVETARELSASSITLPLHARRSAQQPAPANRWAAC